MLGACRCVLVLSTKSEWLKLPTHEKEYEPRQLVGMGRAATMTTKGQDSILPLHRMRSVYDQGAAADVRSWVG